MTFLQAIADHHLPKRLEIMSHLQSTYISSKSSGMTIIDLALLTQTFICQVIKYLCKSLTLRATKSISSTTSKVLHYTPSTVRLVTPWARTDLPCVASASRIGMRKAVSLRSLVQYHWTSSMLESPPEICRALIKIQDYPISTTAWARLWPIWDRPFRKQKLLRCFRKDQSHQGLLRTSRAQSSPKSKSNWKWSWLRTTW